MFNGGERISAAVLFATVGVSSPGSVSSDPASAKYSVSAFTIGDWGTTTDPGSCRSSTFSNYDLNAEAIPNVIIRTTEMLQALDNKLNWQASDTSPNDDRWILKDYFYVHTIEDAESGVSIDIFNVDGNDADVHGAAVTCCQCYGYASSNDNSGCNDVVRQWGNDSRAQLKDKVAASNATWKLINNHYSPYEILNSTRVRLAAAVADKPSALSAQPPTSSVNRQGKVLKGISIRRRNNTRPKNKGVLAETAWFVAATTAGSGIQVCIYDHTHGEKHDYAASHFVENGAGGGIKKEAASEIPSYATAYVKRE
ncbi:hypothetical protein PHYSODRAFT_322630 [Phytophthora sojae]|uniref:Uncharacterized protein n=1 Tax=Phytophthora sojae (strain P6497) TaxID=1094619 RepID=G4YGD8_PHYSP|nr:hypothetical protein PHYSODRAFT_322630 [Phytophthora sojae]EGZ29051.1 hypothetical protein PHYSODRAFT_322630 [Phytophthora sojae]|eukprot:XP_009516326.1 hypothetical protein PHYSODRAFT_322630 [Phytophthora sojae]